MNRGQLVAAIRTETGWTSDDGMTTDPVLQDLIAKVLRIISIEHDWDWLKTSEAISTVAGTVAYTPGATWAKTEGVRVDADYGSWLQQVSAEEADSYLLYGDARGRPEVFAVRGGQIVLRPIPDAVYALTHYFYKVEPALASDSDSPLLPAQFHDGVVALAASFGWARKGDFKRAAEERETYKAIAARMVDDKTRSTQPRRVRPRAGVWS